MQKQLKKVFGAQLIASYLWYDPELGEIRVLGFRADGYTPFEQRPSLEKNIRAMHDVPGVYFAALGLSPEDSAPS